MADDVKKIFKDDIIGKLRSKLVINNEIKGVFGEIADISLIPRDNPDLPNILTTQHVGNETYDLDYFYNRRVISPLNNDLLYYYRYNFDINVELKYSYEAPIENVTASNTKVQLIYDSYFYSNSGFGYDGILPYPKAADTEILDFLTYERFSKWQGYPLNTYINRPNLGETEYGVTENLAINFTVSDIKIHGTSLSFKATSKDEHTTRISYQDALASASKKGSSYALIWSPKYIEVVVRGDTYRITPQAYQIGEQTKAHQMPLNPLVTTKATINGIPLYQYRANKIINEWYNGKQSLSLTKVINDNTALNKVGDKATILNVRKSDLIDENAQSYLKNKDGTAKKFISTSAEFLYNGDYRQRLDMIEDVED